ncbi:MAG TPA: outer membrane lipoprotein carrier protein LolA [Nitrospirota bacterium]|nr:outer membrane lipoprotein carrier protein LolA [Nitrospirota bacterium]
MYTDFIASKRLIFFALIIFFFSALTFAGRPARAQTGQEVVSRVENHYSNVPSLTAKVTQKNLLKAIGKTQTFEGAIWMRKPGKIRIDYTNGQMIMVDGKTALFYSKKSDQVIRKTFADVQQMNVPVTFLLGAAHMSDDFDVLQPDPKSPLSLELLPKKPGAAMKKLNLVTDETGRISNITIFDKSGNTAEIILSEVQEGASVDDRLFSFKVPKGTEIIEQ